MMERYIPHFQEELEQLKARLLEMGGLAEDRLRLSVKSLVDRFKPSDLPDVGDLVPGTGDVVSVAGRKAAAYRDDDGVVHAVSPVCTHLGCQVQFNTAETSWDCPCHGSRYDIDGRVIHGPAVRDLDPVEIDAGESARLT